MNERKEIDTPEEEVGANEYNRNRLFEIQEVLDAIDSTNFNKGIGADGFDGQVLIRDPKVKAKVAGDI